MLKNLKNIIDFYLRSKICFSRKNFVEKNPVLIERNRLENLYTEDVLEQFFEKIDRENVRVLDIGSKNWFYAKGEYNFFKKFCKNFLIDGVEIDPYRLYSNFYNREEVAKFYTHNLENMNYIKGNLLDLNGEYDYIIWFLPFVKPYAHKAWGLPMKYFYPEKLLAHAMNLLKEGGQMLIVNQGKEEAQEQEELLKKICAKHEKLGEIKSEHFEYKNPRFGFIARK